MVVFAYHLGLFPLGYVCFLVSQAWQRPDLLGASSPEELLALSRCQERLGIGARAIVEAREPAFGGEVHVRCLERTIVEKNGESTPRTFKEAPGCSGISQPTRFFGCEYELTISITGSLR